MTAIEIAGWQEIETAPKDGAPVLLYYPNQDDATLQGITEGWYVNQPSGNAVGWETCFGFMHGEPSHWMPLPSSPNPAAFFEKKERAQYERLKGKFDAAPTADKQ